MSWLGALGKAIVKTLAPKAAERLLERWLPTRRPEHTRAPGELSSRDVAVQNRASHVPEAHKVRTYFCQACQRHFVCTGAQFDAHDCAARREQMRPPPPKSHTRYDD